MTIFKPVRNTGHENIPIRDGQLLLDHSKGTIAVDVGETRKHANYVYGIPRHINVNDWIPLDGGYYINISDLVSDNIPYGHSVVGASPITGTTYPQRIITTAEGDIRLTADDRIDGNILIFALAGDIFTNPTDIKGLVSLYHMEETDGSLVDSTGNTTITQGTGWGSNNVSKFGHASICKSSIGYFEIQGISDLNAFTVEWWQYDTSDTGYGGIILEDANGQTLQMIPISNTSNIYASKVWKHIAVSHKYDGPAYVYVDGVLVGFSNVDTPLQGSLKFYGAPSSTESSKVCYIDELAIFNYARYTENFTAPTYPYVGDSEISLAAASDITIEGPSIGGSISIAIPVTTSDDATLSYDVSGISALLSDIQITENTITGTVIDDTPGEYYVIVKSPGSISARVRIVVKAATEDNYYIYYGYFTSDTLQPVMNMTESELSQNTINRVEVGTTDLYIKDIPTGAFTVVLIPESASLSAYKSICGCYCNIGSFNSNVGASGTGSNGGSLTIGNTVYRVFGEFNVAPNSVYVRIAEYTEEAEDDFAYVDNTLYIANEDNTEYIEVENTYMSDALTITGSSDGDGVYVLDSETQTWSN